MPIWIAISDLLYYVYTECPAVCFLGITDLLANSRGRGRERQVDTSLAKILFVHNLIMINTKKYNGKSQN